MLRIFKFIITLIIVISLFAITINVPTIWNKYTSIKKVQKVMVKYAQKNGGFVVDDSGRNPETFFNDLIKTYNLEEDVIEVIFDKPLGEKVNKKSRLSITIIPRISIIVPFGEPITIIGKPMTEYGYSHKFFK